MDYKARFYSPTLGRFIQPDSIIPGAASPQSWNRYSYVMNRPTSFNDPTGHRPSDGCRSEEGCTITQKTIEDDYKRDKDFKDTTARNKCKAGDKIHCSFAQNHPFQTALFPIVMWTGGASAEYFVLEGGAAATAEVLLPKATTVFEKGVVACLRSAVCRAITGMTGGAGLNGEKVFRVWGSDPNKPQMPGSKPWGDSWSPVNPSTVNNFRNLAGLPSGAESGAFNTGRFVSEGIITDASGIIQQTAISLDGQAGGLIEYIIPNAIEKIQLINVSGVNPPY
jgi:hypothetical protein